MYIILRYCTRIMQCCATDRNLPVIYIYVGIYLHCYVRFIHTISRVGDTNNPIRNNNEENWDHIGFWGNFPFLWLLDFLLCQKHQGVCFVCFCLFFLPYLAPVIVVGSALYNITYRNRLFCELRAHTAILHACCGHNKTPHTPTETSPHFKFENEIYFQIEFRFCVLEAAEWNAEYTFCLSLSVGFVVAALLIQTMRA